MSEKLKYELITVPLPSTDQLQLTRFYKDKKQLGAPVFMVHSLFQDSTSFYNEQGGGLASFLAAHGYDVFVADLRGRGQSWPRISSRSDFGSYQLISQDIPALVAAIVRKRGNVPQIWVGHGWGSVLLSACYARFGDELCSVSRMIHFGPRRKTLSQSGLQALKNRWFWNRIAKVLVAFYGYLPLKNFKLSAANESRACFSDYLRWSESDQWSDSVDYLRYNELLQQRQIPPSFYFAVAKDCLFGAVEDVRHFIAELGAHDVRLMVLSRQGGSLHNYNGQQMLQHQDCEQDHFPLLIDWLRGG